MISGSSSSPSLFTLWRKCKQKNNQKDRDGKKREILDEIYEGNWLKQWLKEEAFIHSRNKYSVSNHSVRGIMIHTAEKQLTNNIPSYALVHQQKQ